MFCFKTYPFFSLHLRDERGEGYTSLLTSYLLNAMASLKILTLHYYFPSWFLFKFFKDEREGYTSLLTTHLLHAMASLLAPKGGSPSAWLPLPLEARSVLSKTNFFLQLLLHIRSASGYLGHQPPPGLNAYTGKSFES